jgi:hypothetical protein
MVRDGSCKAYCGCLLVTLLSLKMQEKTMNTVSQTPPAFAILQGMMESPLL